MAIRAPFRLLLASLVGIFTPIAISPASADPQSNSPEFFEVSAPSPPADLLTPSIPPSDTKSEVESLQDDSSLWVPEDSDPWPSSFPPSSPLQPRPLPSVQAP